MHNDPPAIDLQQKLAENLDAFVGFARKRLGDPQLAADVVQSSFLKALKASGQLEDADKFVPWFYRILRRSIIDVYRERETREEALKRFALEFREEASPEDERNLCACVGKLIGTLKPEYADVLRQVDLEGATVTAAAGKLGLTANNTAVRLHRARAQLRERLEQTCRLCARHGCLDCTCTAA
jgi:RNA polymerase sigma factor (sigma-70 family)